VNTFQIVAVVVVWTALVIVVGRILIRHEVDKIDRISVDELTDNTVHFDPIVDHGQYTDHWPADGLPAESGLNIFDHSDMTVEFFPQLQAKEAQR
jgi:pyruvate-formate lyase-activating enzyme